MTREGYKARCGWERALRREWVRILEERMGLRLMDMATAAELVEHRFLMALLEAVEGDDSGLKSHLVTFPLSFEQRVQYGEYLFGNNAPKRRRGRPIESGQDEELYEAFFKLEERWKEVRATGKYRGRLKQVIAEVAAGEGVDEGKLAELWRLGPNHNRRRRLAYADANPNNND
jgi:hypothetical protein